ncbi:amino acid ABC transporter substrate-binding protein [Paenibacillus sp. HWE-109]|uniref:amino acid ABC transporter substrate-binding protein n=1 Tax=Paenibacillus sp. HWE-109 TaxID=1306526 RepID=UPI001EE082B4|nr:amino acid ABC transporter substrate-binding protein [Paenibacillus sp. HWE-109]UKS28862.1 amino acid ABC transporter substrate-binding protein [Paenibacillus sp. HWE-109]
MVVSKGLQFGKRAGILLAAGLLAISLTACSKKSVGAAGANKVLSIGTTAGFYPYVFQNSETNKLEGYEVDVWTEIGKKIKYEIKWQTSEFSGLFGLLDTGKINTIANSISVTDERKKKYLFDDPYVYSGAQLVVKKGNDGIQSLENLKGKKVAIQSGTNFINFVKDFDKKGEITVVNYETAEAGFNDVALSRVDATFSTKASALATIKKTGLPLQLAGQQFNVLPAANPFVTNDENKQLVEQVNKAFQELRKDGTLGNLSKKWFTEDLTNP